MRPRTLTFLAPALDPTGALAARMSDARPTQ
jgi:hypothetical protein